METEYWGFDIVFHQDKTVIIFNNQFSSKAHHTYKSYIAGKVTA